jgi:TcpE family
VDLPTYTNIWRIEKRLYKLYDFRLPMPLPINWIAVFAGITVPYIVLLVAIGLPFNHTLVWLYVLPPGLLTWLTTRPVIENKRLPELLESQVRYLTEPRVWCRLGPLSEKDQMLVTARVWHSRRVPQSRKTAAGTDGAGTVALRERGTLARRGRGSAAAAIGDPADGNAPLAAASALAAAPAAAPARARARSRSRGSGGPHGRVQGPSGRQRPAGGKTRAPGQDWAAQQRQAAQQTQSPEETWPAQRDQVAGPQSPAAGEQGQAARSGRFRLAALRPRPAPALPPGVALRPAAEPARSRSGGLGQPRPAGPADPRHGDPAQPDQAGGARPWPEGPWRPGTAGPAPWRLAARSGPPIGSVTAPVPSDLAAHATPDVDPAALVPPDLPPRAAPGVPPAPVSPDLLPHAAPDASLAASAAGASGTPRVEIAHDGPEKRPAPLPQVPPANSASAWPVTARPFHPAPQVVPPSAPDSGTEPPAASARDGSPASPDAELDDRGSKLAKTPEGVVDPEELLDAQGTLEAEETDVAEDAQELPAGEASHDSGVSLDSAVSPAQAERLGEMAAHLAALPSGEALPPEVPEPPVEATAGEPEPSVEALPAAEALPPVPAAPVPVVQAVAGADDLVVPSIERALSGPARDRDLSWHGKVKVVAGGGQGPGKRDQEALDRARARLPLTTAKRVLVLGCTSGAGQTVTALMTGHILASLREEPVAAVDLHDGTLARYSAPAAWLEDVLSGKPPLSATSARPDGLHPTPNAAPAQLDVIASRDPLRDGDELKLAVQLTRHYSLAMLDTGAAGLMKLLKVTDQLLVVVPASVDGADALADTRDWLVTHGFTELAAHSVTVINGVSRRSLPDVEDAESVARGRCRAIVRVPWDDVLPAGVSGLSTLRPQTRVAYTALAGVLVAGMAAAPVRSTQ